MYKILNRNIVKVEKCWEMVEGGRVDYIEPFCAYLITCALTVTRLSFNDMLIIWPKEANKILCYKLPTFT